MEVWQIVRYRVAALLALKSLASLMTAYRDRLQHEAAEHEQRRQEQVRARAERAAARK